MISIVESRKEFRTILLSQRLRTYTDNKNLTCKCFNTDRVIRWRLILEESGPDIKYTQGTKSIVAYTLLIFLINGNQETTHKSTYKKEIVSEISDIKELTEGIFPCN